MTNIYIFRDGPWQPLTRYYDTYMEKWFHAPARKKYRCHECRDLRQARSLEVSISYDRMQLRCKGGKHPGWV